jgi:hypothetical protein
VTVRLAFMAGKGLACMLGGCSSIGAGCRGRKFAISGLNYEVERRKDARANGTFLLGIASVAIDVDKFDL